MLPIETDGLIVLKVVLAPSFAKQTRFSQAQLSEWYATDRPCEVWIGKTLYVSNVSAFRRVRHEQEIKASRYLGPGSRLSHLETAEDRNEFERTYSLCLRLYSAVWMCRMLDIPRDTLVLRDEVRKLVGLLGEMDLRGWGTWTRLPCIVADDFLIAVDEGFARVLTASSRTLQASERAKVELLWRSIDDRRKIVKAFIHEHLPSEYGAKLAFDDDDYTTFVEVDAQFLMAQAFKEFTRAKLRFIDPVHLTFPWETETRRLLEKLELGIQSLQHKDHDVRSIFTSAFQEATNSNREILVPGKQVEEIFAGHKRRDDFRRAYLDLMASSTVSTRDLVEEMLASYAPSLLRLMQVGDLK